MSVVIPHRAIEAFSNASDPREAILKMIGDLSGLELVGDQVLLGIYIRPEKTKGGIIRPTVNVQEDVWQGKVGLVLKMGPDAFRDRQTGDLYEQRFEVGEWAIFDVNNSRSVQIREVPCRWIRDIHLIGKVKDPLMIF